MSQVVIDKARRRGEAAAHACRYEQADAWDLPGLQRLAPSGTGGFDVVYVDIGGISGSEGVLEGLALVRLLAKVVCVCVLRVCARAYTCMSVCALVRLVAR